MLHSNAENLKEMFQIIRVFAPGPHLGDASGSDWGSEAGPWTLHILGLCCVISSDGIFFPYYRLLISIFFIVDKKLIRSLSKDRHCVNGYAERTEDTMKDLTKSFGEHFFNITFCELTEPEIVYAYSLIH